MINGIIVKNLKVIPDERGWLMEILRCDDKHFQQFGQVYLSVTYPGVVKGWHYHKQQTDNIVCVSGMIKLVLYDNREESKTKSEINEFCLGTLNPVLIQVPPLIYHGWKCIGRQESYVNNIPTLPYNYNTPDEFRLDPRDKSIPYDWYKCTDK